MTHTPERNTSDEVARQVALYLLGGQSDNSNNPRLTPQDHPEIPTYNQHLTGTSKPGGVTTGSGSRTQVPSGNLSLDKTSLTIDNSMTISRLKRLFKRERRFRRAVPYIVPAAFILLSLGKCSFDFLDREDTVNYGRISPTTSSAPANPAPGRPDVASSFTPSISPQTTAIPEGVEPSIETQAPSKPSPAIIPLNFKDLLGCDTLNTTNTIASIKLPFSLKRNSHNYVVQSDEVEIGFSNCISSSEAFVQNNGSIDALSNTFFANVVVDTALVESKATITGNFSINNSSTWAMLAAQGSTDTTLDEICETNPKIWGCPGGDINMPPEAKLTADEQTVVIDATKALIAIKTQNKCGDNQQDRYLQYLTAALKSQANSAGYDPNMVSVTYTNRDTSFVYTPGDITVLNSQARTARDLFGGSLNVKCDDKEIVAELN